MIARFARRASTTAPSRRSRKAKQAGFRTIINATLFNNAEADKVAAFFDDVMAMGIDGISVSPGYAYERAPDQQHFLNRRATKELFRGIFARQGKGRGREVGVQPVLDVPRFPGRQPDIPLHALGQPDTHLFRLAAALLPARRRLRQDLQGADGNDRLGPVRHRQLRKMRRLHGA